MATLTATAYDATYGAVTVTKSTNRDFTHAVIRVADDGGVTASFHTTRVLAERAAGKPAPGVTRHVVGTRPTRSVEFVPACPAAAATVRAASAGGLTEISAGVAGTDAMRAELNRGVMVAWINADLINRADCDIRRSVVLYDAERVFVMALGVSVTPDIFRERVALVADSMARAGIRFWSVGFA